ncbi:MAG: RNA polymerase sigma factor [Planctomycetota bacterium]
MGDWDLPRDPLAALREGNPAPFEDFVRSHSRLLVAWFRRQGAGLHRAEDLCQEVVIKLYQHAPRYRAEERFAAFVFRVARNVWIDDRRRLGLRPGAATLDGPAGEEPRADRLRPDQIRRGPESPPEPLECAAAREGAARLRAAVAALPAPQRAVFELGALDGLSYAEIGALLEIPVGTVKSRMFCAVRRLRELLGGEEEA